MGAPEALHLGPWESTDLGLRKLKSFIPHRLLPESRPVFINPVHLDVNRQSGHNRAPCKALVHSGCESHPGTGSLHPVAIEAVVEATKLLKPSM
jgi:hypothetical protein